MDVEVVDAWAEANGVRESVRRHWLTWECARGHRARLESTRVQYELRACRECKAARMLRSLPGRKPGRPRLSEGGRAVLVVYATPELREMVEWAAGGGGKSVSAWIVEAVKAKLEGM